MQKQVRLVSMLLCLGMGVAGALPAMQPVMKLLPYSRTETVKVL